MKNFVGIDLGTTNSAICSYDGTATRVWKSPEQNDVTPSAIYFGQRGNQYVGQRAYDSAPQSPDNAATLFKRLMGTSTPVEISAVGLTKTPEECSAEVLKTLFGYLPEEMRNDPDTGTVITVPAAFNQMQKDATMQAADMAGLGSVALMQEPVAAVMSVMRARDTDGMFLIYDLGGGTLDIAVAESIGGRVNLLAHGGIAMCGGRDFDRALMDNIVRPWLLENFNLPDDFSANPDFKALVRLATWATERAKIELSSREDTTVGLSEVEIRAKDLDGNEIYLDIPLQRDAYDKLIADRVDESIAAARTTLKKTGLRPDDLERVVFVGGPTNYKPLRDKVAFELGMEGDTNVNPMTAVAEGASLFAESIDWSTKSRSRKDSRGQVSSGGEVGVSLNYTARTPDSKAKIAFQLAEQAAQGLTFQVDSTDTGWTSGRMPLTHGATIDLSLAKAGENAFKVFAFDATDNPIALEQKGQIVITRTAATVEAIPASHSIGVAVLGTLGDQIELDYLVREGDSLPAKGKRTYKAAESLKARSSDSLNFNLWEGDIEDPITDNRQIGVMKIPGSDFDEGAISVGDELECSFEVLDSGNIVLEVSVPSIGGVFSSGKNFYSRQEGQIDYTSAATMVREEGEQTLNRIAEISRVVSDPRLDEARDKLDSASSLDPDEAETEKSQEAMDKVHEARKLTAEVRGEHLKEIRQLDLERAVAYFDEHVRPHARPSEAKACDALEKTANRSIERGDNDFEHHLDELRRRSFEILWRQDWFVIERFRGMIGSPHRFSDASRYEELASQGEECIRSDEIDKLRAIVGHLHGIWIGSVPDDDALGLTNIMRV